MTDLLDLLASLEQTERLTHVLMPCMAYACGQNIVDHGGSFQVGINNWDAITCPGCRRHDPDELRADMRRQQGMQEAVR